MTSKYVNLPREFIILLQSNMQTSGHGYALLRKSLWSSASFQSMIARTCSDIDGNLSFEKIINSLGWLGLRDRFANAYLHYQKFGRFPQAPTLELVEDILDFESKLKGNTVDGYGRAFLFGFYKKMNYFKEESQLTSINGSLKNTRQEGLPFKIISDDSYKLLGIMKSRCAFIDWLCLAVDSTCEFHGFERVHKLISSGGGFASLRHGLDKKQEYLLMRRFLSYGASIQHMDVFYNPTV